MDSLVAGVLLLAALGRGQDGKDEFDQLVRRVVESPGVESNYQLRTEGPKHWDWLALTYKGAKGQGRARILYAIHTPPGNLSPLLPIAVRERSASLRAMAAAYVAHVDATDRRGWRESMVRLLRRDKSVAVRRSLATHLSWSSDGADLLRPMLRDSDSVVRIIAAVTVGRSGDVSTIPVLIALLDRQAGYSNTHSEGGQPDVETTLAGFSGKAVRPIRSAIAKSSGEKRARAMNVLRLIRLSPYPKGERVSSEDLFSVGKRYLGDRSPAVRKMAADLIVVDRPPGAIPLLVKMLRDSDESVRKHAAVRLEYGDKLESRNVWPEGHEALARSRGRGENAPNGMISR